MVSSVTVHDSVWSVEDRELALAWSDRQRSLCGGCGHPLGETTDPANEGVYEATHILVCDACAARDAAVSGRFPERRPAGLHVLVQHPDDFDDDDLEDEEEVMTEDG
jgi:hypothetical protein